MDANEMSQHDERVGIIQQIIWLSRRHFQISTRMMEESGLLSGQIPVLMELSHHGALSQRDLAEKAHVTAATMSGTLKRMERSGLICRTTDENDARVFRVQLTEEGHAQCEKARQAFHQSCHLMLGELDEDALHILKGLLGRIRGDVGGPGKCESLKEKE